MTIVPNHHISFSPILILYFEGERRPTYDVENGTDEQDRDPPKVVADLGVRWLSCCGYDRTDDADC
jgi:hypothetical protein